MPVENKRDLRNHAIIGAAMEIQRQLGCGFLEAVYQKAFQQELLDRNIPFRREVHIPIFYRSVRLAADYRADFIGFDSVVVELRAIQRLR